MPPKHLQPGSDPWSISIRSWSRPLRGVRNCFRYPDETGRASTRRSCWIHLVKKDSESSSPFWRKIKVGKFQPLSPRGFTPFRETSKSLGTKNRFRYIPANEIANWKKLFPERDQQPTDIEKAVRGRLWQKQLEVVRRMNEAGVPFVAGTDLGTAYIYPGFSLHDELTLFVEAGFTPLEALRAATRNPAEFLGLLDSLGTVEKGKIADLVLLNANPL